MDLTSLLNKSTEAALQVSLTFDDWKSDPVHLLSGCCSPDLGWVSNSNNFSVHTAPGLFWDSCADGFVVVHSPSKIQTDTFCCCCHLFAGCGSNGGCRHFVREE